MAAFAARVAREIIRVYPSKIRVNQRRATVVALVGELGAGKTAFVQGFLKSFGVKERVVSPTFILLRPHRLSIRHLALGIRHYSAAYHVDCYRIDSPRELISLGFKKIISNPQNIVLIEWADKIKKFLPKNTHWIKFRHGVKSTERIVSF